MEGIITTLHTAKMTTKQEDLHPSHMIEIAAKAISQAGVKAWWNGEPKDLTEPIMDWIEDSTIGPNYYKARYGIKNAEKFLTLLTRWFPHFQELNSKDTDPEEWVIFGEK